MTIINADFETYDFKDRTFDVIYSAATIQWIPEQIGFPKISRLAKDGATVAMMMTHTDERTANEALYEKIQSVYKNLYHPAEEYTCHLEYKNIVNYGFSNFERREYYKQRVYTADEYVSCIGTHCTHITLQEPDRTKFYTGITEAVLENGNKITLNDTIVLYLATRKYA